MEKLRGGVTIVGAGNTRSPTNVVTLEAGSVAVNDPPATASAGCAATLTFAEAIHGGTAVSVAVVDFFSRRERARPVRRLVVVMLGLPNLLALADRERIRREAGAVNVPAHDVEVLSGDGIVEQRVRHRPPELKRLGRDHLC